MSLSLSLCIRLFTSLFLDATHPRGDLTPPYIISFKSPHRRHFATNRKHGRQAVAASASRAPPPPRGHVGASDPAARTPGLGPAPKRFGAEPSSARRCPHVQLSSIYLSSYQSGPGPALGGRGAVLGGGAGASPASVGGAPCRRRPTSSARAPPTCSSPPTPRPLPAAPSLSATLLRSASLPRRRQAERRSGPEGASARRARRG